MTKSNRGFNIHRCSFSNHASKKCDIQAIIGRNPCFFKKLVDFLILYISCFKFFALCIVSQSLIFKITQEKQRIIRKTFCNSFSAFFGSVRILTQQRNGFNHLFFYFFRADAKSNP